MTEAQKRVKRVAKRAKQIRDKAGYKTVTVKKKVYKMTMQEAMSKAWKEEKRK